MGRYRPINVDLNRQYRNDLNKNFEDIERDISKVESDIARVEAESKERDNLIAGTDVEAIIERIDTSADNADVQAQHAKTQGDYAKTQGDYALGQGNYAQSKGDYADEKAILADEAAGNANSEASNLSQLKIDVVDATQNANTATNNANTATTNANNSATYATEQGDYAKREADRVAGMDVGQITAKIGELTELQTENKTNLVKAVNEVDSDLTSLQQQVTQHLDDYNKFKQRKRIIISRSVASPSGQQRVSGIGFRANKFTVYTVLQGTALYSLGTQLGTDIMKINNAGSSSAYFNNFDAVGSVVVDAINYISLKIENIDDDGFDIIWTLVGNMSSYSENPISVSIVTEG